MVHKRTTGLLLAGFAVLSCSDADAPALAQCVLEPWQTEVVDDSTDQLSTAVVALDSDGEPHVAYLGPAGSLASVRHGYRNAAGVWSLEEVPNALTPVGRAISLALDADDQPAISFVDWTHFTGGTDPGIVLGVARRDGRGWTTTAVGDERVDDAGALQRAPDGTLHLLFGFEDELAHAVGEVGEPFVEVDRIRVGWMSFESILMAFGPDDSLHALFNLSNASDPSPEVAAHAIRDARGEWTLEGSLDLGDVTGIWVEADGALAVTALIEDFEGDCGCECFDDECTCGPPCVRFDERHFLTRSAGADSFDEQVIAERAPVGEGWGVRPAPVVVDGAGHVHTVFVEDGSVMHGERDPDTGAWSFEPLPDAAAGDLGRQALAVGRDGALHAVWIDDHHRVRHASRVCAR